MDRGTLARVDRRVFVELDHFDGVQAVIVPVSDAVWSTWRRYCEALALTMGQAIAVLIGHELATVVGETPNRVFDLQSALEERARRLDVRERELDDRERRLRRAEDLLREREVREKSAPVSGAVALVRVGRNEACPCGSGLKYKRCHGQRV
ncbi:MAG TPA: SEC-C domain-containing protein [Acidimicrobiia bacterium]|nr:SEC-C domain-containing protein [Acidimicrobiia bacterium]